MITTNSNLTHEDLEDLLYEISKYISKDHPRLINSILTFKGNTKELKKLIINVHNAWVGLIRRPK